MFHRGYRGSRRRAFRPVIKSYKKVLYGAPASFGAGFNSIFLVQGKDNISPNQSNATDADVPTGSIVKYIEIQFAISNLVSIACFINCSIQYTLAGQSAKNPNQIGGSNQRNQVMHLDLYSVGANQNSTHKFKFKVPKQFQRVKEGMDWTLTWSNSESVTMNSQAIYKMYS